MNWDRVIENNGKSLDPDGGESAISLKYMINRDYSSGYKTYPQGYGILLSIIYEIYFKSCGLFGDKEIRAWMMNVNEAKKEAIRKTGKYISPEMPTNLKIRTIMVGRFVSSLAIFFSIIVIAIVGWRYYGGSISGSMAAILFISSYPFLMYSQIIKYPAMQIFSFMISFYLICNVYQKRTYRYYAYCGIAIGYAISVIYYNGIALFILFYAHVLIVLENTNKDSFYKKLSAILFSKKIWTANLLCIAIFAVFNPALFLNSHKGSYKILGWAYTLTLSRRTDLLFTDKFTGTFSFMNYIASDYGTGIALIIIFSIISLIFLRRRPYIKLAGFGVLTYLLFYKLSNIHQSYLFANAIPLSMLIVAQALLIIYRYYPRRIMKIGMASFILLISIPGLSRSYFQNSINKNHIPTYYSARKFISSIDPKGAIVLTDLGGFISRKEDNNKYIMLSLYPGSTMVFSTSIRELFPVNQNFMDSKYALIGYFKSKLEVLYQIKKNNSYGDDIGAVERLIDAVENLYKILDKKADLKKSIPGKWIGMDQRNLHGYRFSGFGYREILEFIENDHRNMSYGESLKLYELNPSFKNYLLNEVSCTIRENNSSAVETATFNVGIKGLLLTSMDITDKNRGFNVVLHWKADKNIPLYTGKLFLTFHHDEYSLNYEISLKKISTGIKKRTWIKEWQPTIIVPSNKIENHRFSTVHRIEDFGSLTKGAYSIYLGGL